MALKSFAVPVLTTDTEVVECPATLEGAIVLNVSNVSGGASTFTVKLYKQALGDTITVASSVAIAANTPTKYEVPLALEAGDKIVMTAGANDAIVVSGIFTLSEVKPAAVGFTPRGDYDSGATYQTNDVASFTDGNSYLSMQDDNTDNQPDESPAYWMVLAEKGEDGAPGDLGGLVGDDGELLIPEIETPDTPSAGIGALYFKDDGKLYAKSSAGDETEIGTGGGSGGGSISPPQGRLTLTSGVAVTTSDVTGATTIYYTPAGGQNVPVYDGGAWAMHDMGGELSLALDSNSGHTNYHQSGKNFDLFYAVVSGTYYFGSGPKWDDGAVAGSDTARGTGAASTELELYGGFFVNKNELTLRHGSESGDTVTVPARQATLLGSFRAVADGQATDAAAKRLVANVYSRSRRALRRQDPAASWDYNTDTFRQMNANSANKVEVLCALTAIHVVLLLNATINNGSASLSRCAIGLDSTSAFDPASTIGMSSGSGFFSFSAAYSDSPGLGYHFFAMLERSSATSCTWFGTGAAYATGFIGDVFL